MQTIDEARLETDSQYRYEYLAEFIGFGPADAAIIQASAPHPGPRIGEFVEKTCEKLLSFDATARHFVPRQHGFDADIPDILAELSANHPQIRFRGSSRFAVIGNLVKRSSGTAAFVGGV